MRSSALMNDPDSAYCYDPRDDEKSCECVAGWIDVHDDVGDIDDLAGREYELIDQRIHVRCRDCQGPPRIVNACDHYGPGCRCGAFSDLSW